MSSYIGNEPASTYAGSIVAQQLSGNNSTTTFTLNSTPVSVANTSVYINGIYQNKSTYAIIGTSLVFDQAPPSGTNNIEVVVSSTLPFGVGAASSITFAPTGNITSTNVQSAINEVVTDLALSGGASGVGFLQAGSGAIARTLQDKNRDIVSVKDFGAVGDGVTDDTAAIQSAINYAAGIGAGVYFPGGVYIVTPSIPQVGAASYNTALVMVSNMHIVGNTATIKIANNYSTDAAPKELAVFSTVNHIGNISFYGITFDLNGSNNKISPARPSTYNQFNHAAIIANGPTGYIDDIDIDGCTFKDTAGVCFIVAQLVAANTSPPIGLRWKITNNLFINGGKDTNDHTSVYALCEDCVCTGNTFWQDSPPHTIGSTGGATGYEVHGSNHRVSNNYIYNYTLGLYISGNFTNDTTNTLVTNNNIYCSDAGVIIYRGFNMLPIDGVIVAHNTCYFDAYTYSGQPIYRAFLAFQGQIANQQGVSNINVYGNYAKDSGAHGSKLMSRFVHWDTVSSGTTGANTTSNLSITDNHSVGFTEGVYLNTNTSNGLGLTDVSRNQFIAFNGDNLGNTAKGININAGGIGITTFVVKDNHFVDERTTSHFSYAMYISGGSISDLSMGNQVFKGMLAANFYNAGGAAITRSIGTADTVGVSNISDGGTITFNGDYTGFTPRAITVTGSIAGEILSVTTYGSNTFTVAIKKIMAGVVVPGTPQSVYWAVRF